MYNNTLFSKIFVISFLCISFHNTYEAMTLAGAKKKKAAATKAKLDQKLKEGANVSNINNIKTFKNDVNKLLKEYEANTNKKQAQQEKKLVETKLKTIVTTYEEKQEEEEKEPESLLKSKSKKKKKKTQTTQTKKGTKKPTKKKTLTTQTQTTETIEEQIQKYVNTNVMSFLKIIDDKFLTMSLPTKNGEYDYGIGTKNYADITTLLNRFTDLKEASEKANETGNIISLKQIAVNILTKLEECTKYMQNDIPNTIQKWIKQVKEPKFCNDIGQMPSTIDLLASIGSATKIFNMWGHFLGENDRFSNLLEIAFDKNEKKMKTFLYKNTIDCFVNAIDSITEKLPTIIGIGVVA